VRVSESESVRVSESESESESESVRVSERVCVRDREEWVGRCEMI
jgi:hypothetical protein